MTGWQKRPPHEGSYVDAGNGLTLSTTNQTYRGCGWVFHVEMEGNNGGDTVLNLGGFDSEAAAINAANDWLRQFCANALAAIGERPQGGAS